MTSPQFMKRLREEAKNMIQINSVTSHGNEDLVHYVSGLMKVMGLKVQQQLIMHSLDEISKRQFNVIGTLGDPLVDRKTRKGLLLSSHLDTVPAGMNQNWTETEGDPYRSLIKEGKLYGLGSVDAKVDFLCKLHALEKFREKKLKMPVYLVGTAGNELGVFGSKYLIKSLLLNPKYVFVGAPTELKLVHAHKCLVNYKVSIDYQLMDRDARGFNRKVCLFSQGKSAHSVYPDLGTHAIKQLLDFISLAEQNGFELRFSNIQGGESIHKIPDKAQAEFYLSAHQFEDFKRFYRESNILNKKGNAFRIELWGSGEMGVRFLPEKIFHCILELINSVEKLADELKKKRESDYSPPYSSVSLVYLKQRQGGIDLGFDFSLLPEKDFKGLVDGVEMILKLKMKAVASQYVNFNFSLSKENVNPSLLVSPESEWVQISLECLGGQAESLQKMSFPTEAALYEQSGYNALVYGPGTSYDNSHSPNESCSLEQAEKAIYFYEKVIEKVCL